MGKALYDKDQIIQKGEEITAERGRLATAWQIQKRCEGRGKLERYERIWREYCETRAAQPPLTEVAELAVPDAAQTRIDECVNTLGSTVSRIVEDVIRGQLDQARRQISLAQQAHDYQLREVIEERDYLRDHVSDLEDALERAEKGISALERKLARAGSSKPPRAKASKAAAKSPRQSPRQTPPTPQDDTAPPSP